MNLLTPEEVAQRLRVSVLTLANWRSAGRGPAFVKVGRTVRYEESAIEAYLKQQTVER